VELTKNNPVTELRIGNPATIYIYFPGPEFPKYFCLKDQNGNLYYFRFLDGKTPRIKFNIPDSAVYTSNVPFCIIKIVAIEIPPNFPVLPQAQRDREKESTIIFNPDLQGTPARIFTDSGIIEVSKEFYSYPAPVRLFILLHETGHYFYTSEESCDMWALVNYLRMGYNRSMAFYTLYKILRYTNANIERLQYLLNNIKSTSDGFAKTQA
jgi:hypothetical protein